MENTHLIVGLGNPGSEYARTRHNAGFMAVERLADGCRAPWRNEQKFQSRLARADFRGVPLLICEPQTYMNASGVAVESVVRFYKLELSRVLIIVDDADLPLGTIRLRMGGSPGGHHGLESIERHLGTRDYARLRVGIGRRSPQVREITNHVLGAFGSDESGMLQAVLQRVVDQTECWLTKGIQKAMNEFNGAIDAPMAKDQLVKKYEGLFILNTAGKEENVKEIVDKITAEIATAGGKIETVQKMEKRNFSRIADKKVNSGYYVNVIFDASAPTVDQLKSRFSLNDDVFRVMFTKAPAAKPTAVVAA